MTHLRLNFCLKWIPRQGIYFNTADSNSERNRKMSLAWFVSVPIFLIFKLISIRLEITFAKISKTTAQRDGTNAMEIKLAEKSPVREKLNIFLHRSLIEIPGNFHLTAFFDSDFITQRCSR